MKKILLLAVLTHTVILTFSQKLTLTEMIEKTKCTTFSEFNNYISTKGFSFVTLDTSCCDGYLYHFTSDKKIDTLPNGKVYPTICQFTIGKGYKVNESDISIDFMTSTKSNYLPFLKQLESLNFSLIHESAVSDGNGMFMLYSSPLFKDIQVRIMLVTNAKSINTTYSISAVRTIKI